MTPEERLDLFVARGRRAARRASRPQWWSPHDVEPPRRRERASNSRHMSSTRTTSGSFLLRALLVLVADLATAEVRDDLLRSLAGLSLRRRHRAGTLRFRRLHLVTAFLED